MIGQALEHTRGGKGDPAPQPQELAMTLLALVSNQLTVLEPE
jgi:hypothetical protein